MPKKTKISTEDIAAFEEATKGTRRYIHKKTRLKPASKPMQRTSAAYEEDDAGLDGLVDTPVVSSEEYISYKHPSISDKILRKLRKGQYNVDARLDLHGMNVDQAKKAAVEFLKTCIEENIRVAIIIHGKSRLSDKPILKNNLNRWLRTMDVVLAFCSAKMSHGSRGAVYVLLKHTTEEKYV